jgi:hypothetical protein
MPEIERALRETIRQRLEDGALPRVKPSAMWGGPGTGRECQACGLTISKGRMEFEVEFSTAPASQVLQTALVLHFHATCFAAWELERELWLRSSQTA